MYWSYCGIRSKLGLPKGYDFPSILSAMSSMPNVFSLLELTPPICPVKASHSKWEDSKLNALECCLLHHPFSLCMPTMYYLHSCLTTPLLLRLTPIRPTPPPPNYNINFSYQWKQAPRVNLPTKRRQPLTLLPNKYNSAHIIKYIPTQCIYVDDSFIPPPKIAKGHMIGNIAGS